MKMMVAIKKCLIFIIRVRPALQGGGGGTPSAEALPIFSVCGVLVSAVKLFDGIFLNSPLNTSAESCQAAYFT
jgi:hypothetical protein